MLLQGDNLILLCPPTPTPPPGGGKEIEKEQKEILAAVEIFMSQFSLRMIRW